jgi:hypothetical protein
MAALFSGQEIRRPEDIIQFLAKGQRHWRKGFSAYELAHAWVLADGIPGAIRAVLDRDPIYRSAELIEGFFEREVDLRTPGRCSQTDLMALVKIGDGYAILAIEGKVDEPFGQRVADWNDGSHGRQHRLERLCGTLGLAPDKAMELRYQLLHRSASAVYEAHRYRCGRALMLVHTFSRSATSLDDFLDFAEALGARAAASGGLSRPVTCEGVELRLGWVVDQPRP